MLVDALAVDLIVELRVEASEVEPQLIGIVTQRAVVQMHFMVEQQIVHRPEFMLSRGRLCGFCGALSMRMHFRERKVPEREAHVMPKVLQQQLDRWISLGAVRALEIAVFDDDDARILRTNDMVRAVDRYSEREGLGAHDGCVLRNGQSPPIRFISTRGSEHQLA